MLAYKLHIANYPERRDYKARTQFANWYLQNIRNDEFFPSRVVYSEEYVFRVDCKVNKRKVRIRGTESLMSEEKKLAIKKK